MFREWSLVAFTVAGQMAVGVFLLAGIPILLLTRPAADAAARKAGLTVLVLVLGLMTLATLLSFFHLSHPFRARRALANLQTSWLSREIFFELGFMGLVALSLLIAWRRPADVGLLKAVLITAGFAGALFLVSMTKIYMLQTIPSWNQAYTPLSFFITSLSLGALAFALFTGVGAKRPSQAGSFILLSFILVAADIAVAFFIAPGYGLLGHRPGPSLRPPGEAHRMLHLAGLGFLLGGLVLIGTAMIEGEGPAASGLGGNGLLAIALMLVLAGQVTGRFLFYGLFTRPGPLSCRRRTAGS